MQKPQRLFTQNWKEVPNKLWEEKIKELTKKHIKGLVKIMLDNNLSWHEYLSMVTSELQMNAIFDLRLKQARDQAKKMGTLKKHGLTFRWNDKRKRWVEVK